MSTALYRRYRPETFADVIGQEHVTEPLMQALRSGRVNHAYLFSGPRGCGKTTSARILARCLNCDQGPTAQPCGECDSCRALARGGPGSVDVIEIDAASHGGVDDARDLRERAAFGPASSRYKVYIIDEAHMVSNQGFNALLKVVEEPPEHVKFIFATTEPDKVISTIRSRTHHYPFHLVPPQQLTTYLEQVCEAEGVQLEPGVLSFVIRAGGGSVRDTLSVLDQLISGAGEEGLTYTRTAALLGFTDLELLDAVVEAVAAGDGAAVFNQIDRVMESGHDPRRFAEDLLERYRDLIVLSAVGERAGALMRGLPEDQVARMRQQAASYGAESLSRCADLVNRALSEMTGAVAYRLHLELLGARLLLPGASGEAGHGARLDRIERRLHASGPVGAAPEPARERPYPGPPDRPAPVPPPQQPPVPPQERATRPAEPVPTQAHARPVGAMDTEAVRRSWPDVLDRIKSIRRVTWTLVSANSTVLDYNGERLLLGLSSAGLAQTFREGHHQEVVRQAVSETLALDTRVEGVAQGEGGGGLGGGSGSAPGGPRPSVAPAAGSTSGAHRGTGPATAGPAGPAPAGPGPAGPAPAVPGPAATDPSVGGQGAAPSGRAPSRDHGARGPQGAADRGAQGSDWAAAPSTPAPSWAAGAAAPPGAAGSPGAPGADRGHQPAGRARDADRDGPSGSGGPEGPGPSGPSDPSGPTSPSGPSDSNGAGQAPVQGTAATPTRARGGDLPSRDDEDLESSGMVGQPVIASVLGGTVISIDEEPGA